MKTIIKSSVYCLIIVSFIKVSAQDKEYARALIDTMSSPFMYGRGYIKHGDSLAASFIASQFEQWGLKPFGNDYYQPFNLHVNTFPAEVSVSLNGITLNPGDEFVVGTASHSDQGIYPVKKLRQRIIEKSGKLHRFVRRDYSGHYILFDLKTDENQSRNAWQIADSLVFSHAIRARGAIFPRRSVSWHVWAKEMSREPFTTVNVRKDVLPGNIKKISINVDSRYLENYTTRNVIAWIPGKTQPDSFLVVSAHYDHLGMMGTHTLFPGANDNASGTAMLTDLARHYSLPENQHAYSIAFMAFAGEETGLLGSKYYTENPLFPLERIKFLINLDMVGTGGDGLLVFNGTTDSVRYETMKAINDHNQFLKELRVRGESRSSDHYYFHKKGVPAFFLLTFGSEHRYYHDIYDTREALPLTKYEEVFRLITGYFNTF